MNNEFEKVARWRITGSRTRDFLKVLNCLFSDGVLCSASLPVRDEWHVETINEVAGTILTAAFSDSLDTGTQLELTAIEPTVAPAPIAAQAAADGPCAMALATFTCTPERAAKVASLRQSGEISAD